MPPKKEVKKETKVSVKNEDYLPPGYDIEMHQRVLRYTEIWQNSCESENSAKEIFELLMDGVNAHLID